MDSVFQNVYQYLNLQKLTKKQQEKLDKELSELFKLAFFDFVLSNLSPEDKKNFLSLLKKDKVEGSEAMSFAREKIPNLEKEASFHVLKKLQELKK